MRYRRTIIIMMVFGFFFSSMMIFSGTAHAWSAYVKWTSDTPKPGGYINFHINILNTGSSSMKIVWVGVHFDWMNENYYYYSNDVSDDKPYILKSGDSVSFNIYHIPIPQQITTNTYHALKIGIKAADPGLIFEWGIPYTKYVDSSIFVPPIQYVLTGHVYDEGTSKPIRANYEIDTEDGAMVYYKPTNDNGYFSVELYPGTYIIKITADGYYSQTKTVTINGNMDLNFYLVPILYKVSGYVYESGTNKPISGATITIGPKTTHTNSAGYFSIQIKKGTYTMSVEADNYKDYQTTLVVSGNLKKEVVLEPVKKSILNNAAGNGGDIASLTIGVLVLVIFIIVIVGLVWRSKKRKENYEVRYEDTENLETEQQMIGMGEVNKEEDEITEKLGKLKELYEEGLITEEEYKERRKKLLDNL